MNRVYDFLHAFLDFENAKRLIVYGIILILMMIVRPDGLLTRDSLPRLPFRAGRRAMRERTGNPCLAIEGLTKRFGGFYALNDLQHGGGARPHPRADRTERRRQDHVFQSRHRRARRPIPGEIPSRAMSIARRAPVAAHAAAASRAPSRTSACSRI